MKANRLYSIGTLAMIIFTVCGKAAAQDYGFYNQMFSNMLSNRIWDNIYERSSPGYADAKRKLSASGSNSAGTTSITPVTPERMNRSVQFRSTGTQLMTQTFADGVGEKYKANKADTKELFTAVLERYDREAAAKGLPNDLALAVVSYIALNSHVYRGGKVKSLLDLDQHSAQRDQVAEYAAQQGIFDRMNDRQRQEMYEALILVAVFTHILYNDAQKYNDDQALKGAKHLAKQNLKNIGIKP